MANNAPAGILANAGELRAYLEWVMMGSSHVNLNRIKRYTVMLDLYCRVVGLLGMNRQPVRFGGLKQIQDFLSTTSNMAVTIAEVKRAPIKRDPRLAHPFQAAMKPMTLQVVFAAGMCVQGCLVIHPVVRDVAMLVGVEVLM
jgi:hypothetical protein